MSTRILVPVDGSAPSLRAAALAAHFGRALNARILLLYVFDAPAGAMLGLEPHAAMHATEAGEQLAAAAFRKAQEQMAEVPAARLLVSGKPAQAILTAAAGEGIDHIVMGSRGLSPIRELLLGSVSEVVLRNAQCPVTIVR
jgi:nucleotide-binding universal stress UspA family protein